MLPVKSIKAVELLRRQDVFVDGKLGEDRFRSWLSSSGDREKVNWAGEGVCDRLLHHGNHSEVGILGMVQWGVSRVDIQGRT